MNIHDLPVGSYTVVNQGSGAPLNVKNLAPGSYTVTPPKAQNKDTSKSLSPGTNFPGTAGSLGNTLTSFFPGKQIGQSIGTLGGLVNEKIKGVLGGKDNSKFYDISHPTVEQNVGDIVKGTAMVGGLGVGTPTSIGGSIATGAGIGALQGGGQAAVNKGSFGDIARDTGIGAAVGGAVSGAVTGLGNILESTGGKILNSIIKPSLADTKDGFSMDTVKEFDLGGNLQTMHDKTQSALTDLSSQLKEKLQGSDAQIDLNQIYKDTVNDLNSSKMKNFGSNTSMEGALNELKSEITSVSPDGTASIPDAQLIKQGAGNKGAWQYGATDPESSARQKVYNAFYSKMKTAIEDNSPEGVQEINQKISKLIPVMNAIIRRIPVAARSSVLSLSDMIGLTASVMNASALPLSALSMLSKSGSVGNFLANNASNIAGSLSTAAALGSSGLTVPNSKSQ